MPKAPEKEEFLIDGPAGKLQAMLEIPVGVEQPPRRVAIICHPHPQHQGTMLNKVVHMLARSMNELGIPALRFNFRSVGLSDGSYGEGAGEVEDLLAVTDCVYQRWPDADIWLAGFSFGAIVAAQSANRVGASRLISIAPAVNYLAGLLDNKPAMPWWIIQGDADEVVPVTEVRDWVAANQPGPELTVLPGVDHFFHGQLVQLRELLVSRLVNLKY
jgi:alpha/beta superfamily hydrolase